MIRSLCSNCKTLITRRSKGMVDDLRGFRLCSDPCKSEFFKRMGYFYNPGRRGKPKGVKNGQGCVLGVLDSKPQETGFECLENDFQAISGVPGDLLAAENRKSGRRIQFEQNKGL